MKIGIDIDETIVNTHEIALEYGKKYAPELNPKTYEDVNKFSAREFLEKYIYEIQANVSLKRGVREALDSFKKNGYELIFITARGNSLVYDYEDATKKVFDKYDLPFDKIIYKCYPKGKAAKEENLNYFIDDKEAVLDDVTKYGIKAIRIVNDLTEESKYPKFDDWNEVFKYIVGEEK